MFGAGSDTTASAISITILAAACYPKAQAKVQEELDAIVGRERGVYAFELLWLFRSMWVLNALI
jgi:cytochrome P450